MIVLAPDEVHVWRLDLVIDDGRAAGYLATLDDDEQLRGASFRDPRRGTCWSLARGGLRRLLAAYTGESATSLRLTRGAHGKPALHGSPISFSVSHTHDLALYAFARGREVGVDVERLDAGRVSLRVADAFMDAAAAGRLHSARGELRTREFFRLWTRREAFLKAVGTGLSVDPAPSPGDGWWLVELPLGPEHAGALAVEGTVPSWRLLSFDALPREHAPSAERKLPQSRALCDVSQPARLERECQAPVPAGDHLAA